MSSVFLQLQFNINHCAVLRVVFLNQLQMLCVYTAAKYSYKYSRHFYIAWPHRENVKYSLDMTTQPNNVEIGRQKSLMLVVLYMRSAEKYGWPARVCCWGNCFRILNLTAYMAYTSYHSHTHFATETLNNLYVPLKKSRLSLDSCNMDFPFASITTHNTHTSVRM